MTGKRCATLAAAVFGLAIWAAPADAQPGRSDTGTDTVRNMHPTEFSAQRRPRYRRAVPQVYVRPGRLLYRRCEGWLAVEHRLSGTVIVPRERCWWVRG
jgi:hypothetical protein